MIVLAIRTDKPQAELYLYDGPKRLQAIKWQAHRELAETIHIRIKEILDKSSISLDQLGGVVIYKGPGSFTGLRIGFAVANALAYAQGISIAAAGGQDWIKTGLVNLSAGHFQPVTPDYGQPPHITQPRK